MRKEHLLFMSDPLSHESFNLTVLEEENDHILSGYLETQDSWYPIINGVPRILVNELRENLLQTRYQFLQKYKERLPQNIRNEWEEAVQKIKDFDSFISHQKQTAESFAYEWEHIYKENSFEKQNFFHFAGPYVTEENIAGKKTLDIGCGSGRFTKWAALSGTEVSFGSDLGESVEVAYKLTKDIPNACIVQADIYHMPFKGVFDLAYSIGVLHHLPKPEEGFRRLPSVLKMGGEMVVWVYNRRNNARALYLYEPVRNLLKNLPKPVLYKISYLPAIIAQGLNTLTWILNWYGLRKLAKRIPFSYYANFPFNMKLNDTFDILATPKSNYYFVEEICAWFQRRELKDIKAYEHPEAGITCRGEYAG